MSDDDKGVPIVIAGPAPDEKPKKPRPRLVMEIVQGIMASSKVDRLPTGIPTLDDITRGGLPCPRLVVIGGAPGASKTSVALAIAHHNAKRGVACAILAADEGKEGIVMRLAQREGLVAAQLQDGEGDESIRAMAWQMALDRIGNLPIIIDDGDDDHVTAEYMVESLMVIAQGKPCIFVADSIQTMRSAEIAEDDSIRARVDASVRSMKKLLKKHPNLIIIAVSEVGRGYYRSKSDQINPLAAFKESGGIEYAAATAIVLSQASDDENMFDAVVPKNRGYNKRPFRLHLDRARMTFEEVPMPDAEEQEPARRGTKPELKSDAKAVLIGLTLKHPGLSKGELKHMTMSATPCGRPAAEAALTSALIGGEVITMRHKNNDIVNHRSHPFDRQLQTE